VSGASPTASGVGGLSGVGLGFASITPLTEVPSESGVGGASGTASLHRAIVPGLLLAPTNAAGSQAGSISLNQTGSGSAGGGGAWAYLA
jgi:hypothetical protein